MKLLIILICLGLERYTELGPGLKRFAWFEGYLMQLKQWVKPDAAWDGWRGVLVVILPIVLIVFLLLLILSHPFYGLANVFLSLFILFYCLGPVDLYRELQTYFEVVAEHEGKQQHDIQKELIGGPVPKDTAKANRAVTEAIFLQANERLFGVLFWYILLGPVGAVLYRLTVLLRLRAARPKSQYKKLHDAAAWLQQALDWAPIRLTTLTYMLMGDFTASFKSWMQACAKGVAQNTTLLINCSLAALGIDPKDQACATIEENREAISLIDRATVVILFIIAVFTLGTWIA